MKRSNRRNPASAKRSVEALMPRPDPPDERYTHRVMMNVFGRRFELTTHLESREITKDPAKVIEMPRRRETEL
jgi:hypothetical protein